MLNQVKKSDIFNYTIVQPNVNHHL